jgi:hypothetical protein
MKQFAIILFILLTLGCKSEKKKEIVSAKNTQEQLSYDLSYKPGNIYSAISCRLDSSVTYALYLPVNYDTLSKFPVLFFFDPHAEGLLPVEKYKDLADKYGFIFIGNNNSKNGNSLEANATFGSAMMTDAQTRFSIDGNRIYVCGFSGGSRVAGTIAQTNPSVSGVIACSASMPETANLSASHFMYIGIAGTEDFNYLEMKKQDEGFSNYSLHHELLTFEGKHEWAPVELLNEAITGLELEAMKKHVMPLKNKVADDFIIRSETKAMLLEKSGKKFELRNHYRKMIGFLEGLRDVSVYKKKKDDLEKSVPYQQEVKAKKEAEEKEAVLKNQYVQLLSEKDEVWWSSEINSINQRIKDGKDKEEVLVQKRILNYLSLASYMYSNNAMNQNNSDAAIHFLNLYKIIDPSNSEHSYMLAEVYAKKGISDKSFSYLHDAVKLGFTDLPRLQADENFISLKTFPEFNEVIKEINLKPGKK